MFFYTRNGPGALKWKEACDAFTLSHFRKKKSAHFAKRCRILVGEASVKKTGESFVSRQGIAYIAGNATPFSAFGAAGLPHSLLAVAYRSTSL